MIVITAATQCGGQIKCEITPEAKTLLNDWAISIAAKENIEFATESELTVTVEGKDQSNKMGYTVAIERPDHLAMRSVSARDGRDTIVDGKQLLRTARRDRCYSIHPAPVHLDKVFRRYDLTDPFSEWFLPVVCGRNAPQAVLGGIERVQEIERLELDGMQCRQLLFQAGGSTWTLALQPDNPPIVRQLLWPLSKSPGTKITGRVTLRFRSWSFQPIFDVDTFKIKQPEGWLKVDNALELSIQK